MMVRRGFAVSRILHARHALIVMGLIQPKWEPAKTLQAGYAMHQPGDARIHAQATAQLTSITVRAQILRHYPA